MPHLICTKYNSDVEDEVVFLIREMAAGVLWFYFALYKENENNRS
jgi:hypothetical protein